MDDNNRELLTRIRARAEERALSRSQIWDEACTIMQAAQAIIGQGSPQNVTTTTILHSMEMRMEILSEEILDLQFEENRDAQIAEAT
ncbi:hypothetical protein N7453_002347 [Penicillium expansum]|nr:hypothetical protein N7453_002347 [Penicillium expansum]